MVPLPHDWAGVLSARQPLGHVAFESGDLRLARVHRRAVLPQSRSLRQMLCAAITRYEALGHDRVATPARTNLERLQAIWAGRLDEDDERQG